MRDEDDMNAYAIAALGSVMLLALAGCESATTCEGCGGDGTGASGAGDSATTTGVGGGAGLDWAALITADWQLDAGDEITSDLHFLTLDRDVYVGAIRPIAPQGTHHTVLALDSLDTNRIIYASGVGTNPIIFPEGVGLKLSAGRTVVLQLHLFNASPNAIAGTSGIEIVEVEPGAVVHEANLFLPGPFDFSIPPMQSYVHTGTCTVTSPQNVFAIFPHMHQLGTHFKTTLTVGGVPTVIHDGPYAFDHQAFIPFSPIALQPGDSITTECTWQNTYPQAVGWGESSTSEMCFSILYRYPATESQGFCDDE
jgi:hypothetical protein